MRTILSPVVLFASACSSSSSLPAARFVNANPVRAVDDRRDVPTPPKPVELENDLIDFDNVVRQPAIRPLKLLPKRRALGVNSIDEVPDSTWFTNRIGVRDMTPDEVRQGPVTIDGPEAYVPWTVVGSKREGYTEGVFVVDARGERYLMKFDLKGIPELESGGHVVANRLLWAAGYNVPEDSVAYIHRRDVTIAGNAIFYEKKLNRRRHFEPADLDALFDTTDVGKDGRARVLMSRIVAGRVLGGHFSTGVREDDPNDKIPHELRRDLRGIRALFAWVDNTDVKAANTLDVWVADAERPGRHYVKHYFIDFGKSFGAMSEIKRDGRASYEYTVDYPQILGGLVTVGLRPQPWDNRNAPDLTGIGLYEPTLDPSRWKPFAPIYDPVLSADRYDWYWGAKLVLRFTPQQIRAAVEAGRFTDPRAADYLVTALWRRQREIARYAFTNVNPVDNVTVDPTGSSLCFDDLATRYAITRFGPVEYQLTSYDGNGREVGDMTMMTAAAAEQRGHICTAAIRLAHGSSHYTIVRIRTKGRAGDTYVHLARNPSTKSLRVIGLYRE